MLSMATAATAQDLTTYFMPNVIERTSFNAAFAPERGYVNIPFVGASTLSMNSNVSLGDLIHKVDGESVFLLDTRVSVSDALSGLKDMNYMAFNTKLSLVSFGAYAKDKKSFWDFALNLKVSSNISAPYGLFEFLKCGESINIEDSTSVYIDSYMEAAFGYSRPITDKLTVGARVKFLMGLLNAEMQVEQMDISLGAGDESVWNVQAKGFLDLNAKGTAIDQATFELGDIDFGNYKGISGLGTAIDLGATYDFSDRIRFSAGVNDLGFIVWSKSGNTSASIAKEFTFSAAQVEVDDEGSSVDSDGMSVDFGEMEFEKQASSSSAKWLQANINLGAEYEIFEDLLSAGAIYQMNFWRTETVHNFTAALTCTPLNWVTVATSFAATSNGSTSFGCAANIATGFFNLYAATNILTCKKSAQFIPINQSMMNVSFGLAIPLARGERF